MKIRRLPLPLQIYRGFTRNFEFLVPLIVHSRLKKGKEIQERIQERKGIATLPRTKHAPLFWVHAASVGEFLAVLPIIERLCEKQVQVLLTTMSKTSAQMASQRLPKGAFHQFIPFDTQGAMQRFFEFWQPDLGLVTESELWPNLILEAKAQHIPLVLLNARLSERSYLRWKTKPASIRALLNQFDLILAQSPQDGERFRALKAPHVVNVGNLKFDVPAPPFDLSQLRTLTQHIQGRPVWLAASTHPQEEEMVLETHLRLVKHLPQLLTLIVPRHPQRGLPLAQLAAQKHLSAQRRALNEGISADTAIYIADTVGELGLFFRLAPFTFMGKSFEAKGGQNPIEPIKCGSLVFHGPNTDNFSELYVALNMEKATFRIKSAKHLAAQLHYAFHHEAEIAQKREAAQAVIAQFGGAFARTLRLLDPYLLQIGMQK